MPRKRKTREEILEKAKIDRRRRYENIKSDPALYALQKEKEHQRYLKRKEQKKTLSINDMTPRGKRQQRKKWRENFNKFYKRKLLLKRGIEMINDNTPSCSDNEDPLRVDEKQINFEVGHNPPHNQVVIQDPQPSTFQVDDIYIVENMKKKVKRLRYIMIQKTKAFKSKIDALKKKNERYKKQIMRLKKLLQSPNSKVNELLDDNTKRSEVKKKILFCEAIKKTLESNYKQQPKKAKKEFSDAVIGNKAIIKEHRILTEVKKFCVRDKNKLNVQTEQHFQIMKENIQKFYERDDVSRITAGRKEVITRDKIQKQKRYLLDSLKNLHKVFQEQYCKVSYSFFCKQRPFWVLIPDVNNRDTCVCKIHANMEFLIQGLNKRRILSEKTPNEIIKTLCCYKIECLLKRCELCRHKTVNYLEFNNEEPITFKKWETKKSTYVSKGINKEKRIIEKINMTMSPKEAIAEFEKSISVFIKHEGTRRWQFSAINDLKNNLKEHEAIIHIDFSENYALKYASEVQSFHFGGSRNELTLHTAVIYHVEAGKCTVKSLCTVSENLRHDAAAVWAHIVPLLEYVATLSKKITTIHFLSDSPSSQYRNKTMFFIITKLYWYISGLKLITWNYSESGHGKGAADGVGGTLKRTADAAVARGKDVTTLDSFIRIITNNTQNIKVIVIDEYQIYEKDLLIPKSELLPLNGALKVHQVIWHKDKDELIFREASCFVCIDGNCLHTKMVGKLRYEAQNVHNKENEHSNSSPLIEQPNVIIHSNILLNPVCKSNTEVTRLCDIIPDNKLNLYPEVDIYAMVKEYNISNATSNFSGYFEDPNLINCSLPSICQNVSQGPKPKTLEDFRSPQNSLIEASGSSFRNQVALPISHSLKVSCKGSRNKILDSSDDSIEIKDRNGFVPQKLVPILSTNDTDSDSDLEIFPKRKYFN